MPHNQIADAFSDPQCPDCFDSGTLCPPCWREWKAAQKAPRGRLSGWEWAILLLSVLAIVFALIMQLPAVPNV